MSEDVAALSDEARLIAGLDLVTRRELVRNPPAPTETMQQIGISKGNLDGPVRSWINRAFRRPRNKPVLPPGAITLGTTWAQLLAML